jgi:hypothetical protein
MGHAVQILGLGPLGGAPAAEATDDYVVHRVPLAASYGSGIRTLRPLLRWQWAALRWLVAHRREYAYIHACDFDTVIPSYRGASCSASGSCTTSTTSTSTATTCRAGARARAARGALVRRAAPTA